MQGIAVMAVDMQSGLLPGICRERKTFNAISYNSYIMTTPSGERIPPHSVNKMRSYYKACDMCIHMYSAIV